MDTSGIIFKSIIEGKFDAQNYCQILRQLWESIGRKKNVALFYDGLRVHCTEAV